MPNVNFTKRAAEAVGEIQLYFTQKAFDPRGKDRELFVRRNNPSGQAGRFAIVSIRRT
jgi:hypothetical protein